MVRDVARVEKPGARSKICAHLVTQIVIDNATIINKIKIQRLQLLSRAYKTVVSWKLSIKRNCFEYDIPLISSICAAMWTLELIFWADTSLYPPSYPIIPHYSSALLPRLPVHGRVVSDHHGRCTEDGRHLELAPGVRRRRRQRRPRHPPGTDASPERRRTRQGMTDGTRRVTSSCRLLHFTSQKTAGAGDSKNKEVVGPNSWLLLGTLTDYLSFSVSVVATIVLLIKFLPWKGIVFFHCKSAMSLKKLIRFLPSKFIFENGTSSYNS